LGLRGRDRILSTSHSLAAVLASLRRKRRKPRLGKVEAVRVHDLVLGRHEVLHELLLCIVLPVDLCDRAQLQVRAEGEIDVGAGPLKFSLTTTGIRSVTAKPVLSRLMRWIIVNRPTCWSRMDRTVSQ